MLLHKSNHSNLERHSLLKNFTSSLQYMNSAVLFMIKKCMCVCELACVHMHDRICTHTQKIIFKVGPLSSDDFANHLFPVLL